MILPKNKRPEPSIQSIVDFLYEMGPVKREQITVAGIDFDVAVSTRTKPMQIELVFDHPGAKRYIDKFKSTIFKALKENFDPFFKVDAWPDKKGYEALRFGYRSAGTETVLSLKVLFEEQTPKGGVPAPIQEEGTTIILNRALQDDVDFNSPESILNDKETNKQLTKLFGKRYERKLPEWIYTYYQQNKVWLKEYGNKQWAPFIFGDKDFVTFFTKRMSSLRRSNKPVVGAGDYTTWNPSDIWAVKTGRVDKIKELIKDELKPKPAHLGELNSMLINLMEDDDLIGISLKMVKSGTNAHIKLHNVETSPVLRKLKSFAKLEEYTMHDIHFDYSNIWEDDKVTTYVRLGSNNDYEINITRSGNNISFNTAIKGAAAQGGQTPIAMVVDMLKGKEFNKSHTTYPQTPEALVEETKYEKMYEFVTKKVNGAPTYNEFQLRLDKLYQKKKKLAIVKLMHLAFWYDALTNYSAPNDKSAEFWTDLLYTGMKIKPGRQFAPHAKIS